jgi:hypothetical protein
MLCLELHLAALTDSNDRNVFDPLDNAKIARGHAYSLPQFGLLVWDGQECPFHN